MSKFKTVHVLFNGKPTAFRIDQAKAARAKPAIYTGNRATGRLHTAHIEAYLCNKYGY